MTLKSLAAAMVLLACTTTANFAATLTINGNDYDISTVTGTFLEHKTILESQVWFGDQALATQVAEFSFATDGAYAQNGSHGAYAVFSTEALGVGFSPFIVGTREFGEVRGPISGSNEQVFAIAAPISAVPLPAGGLLLLSGLAGAFGLKRRKKHAA